MNIFKDIKEIKKDLRQFKEKNNQAFWHFKRMIKLFKQVIRKSLFLWILILTMMIVFFWKRDFAPNSVWMYTTQILTFILLSIFIINFFLLIYHHFTKEYEAHIKSSAKSYKNYLRFLTFLGIFLLIPFVGNAQIKYIEHYLTPTLEGCTYYDWYGNELAAFSETTCDDSLEFQVTSHESIEFEVNLPNFYKRIHYQYQYENQKITLKEIKELNIKNGDLIIGEKYENQFLENQFQSSHTYLNAFNHSEQTNAILSSNDIVEVTHNEFEETHMTFTRKNVKDGIRIEYKSQDNLLYRLKKTDELVIETYYNGSDEIKEEIKYENALINKSSNENLFVVSSLTLLEDVYRYQFHKNLQGELNSIDVYKNEELINKNVIIKTDYGFKIMHYSYRRGSLGQIKTNLDEADLCYGKDYVESVSKLNYYADIIYPVSRSCNTSIFYKENPLFLME